VSRIQEMLIRHEGLRLIPYHCPAGKLTIGVGRNLDDLGMTPEECAACGIAPGEWTDLTLTREQALLLLDNDVRRVERELTGAFSWFGGLDPARRDALVDMTFNLGLTRLRGFHRFLAAMGAGEYETAADEMLDSTWSRQVGDRALELSAMIRTGA
jgi:lysozyme